jgi:hypothetical protein
MKSATAQSKLLPSFRTGVVKSVPRRANNAPAPARFLTADKANAKPVVKLQRVKDVDNGHMGTVIGTAGQFLKVQWDHRSKPTLIDPDQVRKSNPKARRYVAVAAPGAKGNGQRVKQNPTETITPARAHRLLLTNTNRHDMINARVNALAKEMRAGTFKAKSPLLIKNGKLIDGRHRLCAVVRANKSVKFPVEIVSTRKSNPPLLADIIGGLAGGAGYAAAAAWVADKLNKGKKKLRGHGAAGADASDDGGSGMQNPRSRKWDYKIETQQRGYVEGGPVSAATRTAAIKKIRSQYKSEGIINLKVSRAEWAESNPKQPNPNSSALQRIFKDFHGHANTGEVFTGLAPAGTPKDLAMLGHLRLIKLANGKSQAFPDGFAQLGAAQQGRTRRLYIVVAQPLKTPAALQNGAPHNYGEIAQVEYTAYKPHLYGTNSPNYLFYHRLGEEGGRRPQLILQNGCFLPIEGDYKIQREGIRD